jgi:hypothetical protein
VTEAGAVAVERFGGGSGAAVTRTGKREGVEAASRPVERARARPTGS